jgi:hypothetical protein
MSLVNSSFPIDLSIHLFSSEALISELNTVVDRNRKIDLLLKQVGVYTPI